MSGDVKSTNITWHHADITREDRERLHGHQSACLWFTGLSGSGKSTLAHEVENQLFEMGCSTIVLDGDNIRFGLNKNLGFSPEDRKENIRRIGEVSKLFIEGGAIAMTAFISPYREDRDIARALVPAGRFFEIYVEADLDVCEKRDPKGLYKKARAGEIKGFTGIDAPYEAPIKPELVVNTGTNDLKACAKTVLDALRKAGIIK
jgi:adenylylsulfate kinase